MEMNCNLLANAARIWNFKNEYPFQNTSINYKHSDFCFIFVFVFCQQSTRITHTSGARNVIWSRQYQLSFLHCWWPRKEIGILNRHRTQHTHNLCIYASSHEIIRVERVAACNQVQDREITYHFFYVCLCRLCLNFYRFNFDWATSLFFIIKICICLQFIRKWVWKVCIGICVKKGWSRPSKKNSI